MKIVKQRKSQGIQDKEGKPNTPLPDNYQALEQGTKNREQLTGYPLEGELFEFSPDIAEYLKSHLFGDIFSRDAVSWQDREIATISMLSVMTGTDGQLKSHIQMCLNLGISSEKLVEVKTVLTEFVSKESGNKLNQFLSH
ncbi:carboxymuconolactone decarboxylase family protein [Acinetobacter baumannii]|uniref:carboxymuconolactone decarboxylase family protein n=1 Tax=Acinetobacter TaxID=469 RepID=UPI0002BA705B|nr:carboxymuconolactone decarboxylase family protein [Acinetobacter baumannii]ANC35355.1 hypothetical protein Aba3207_01425 [Acinetobacter baumannii]AXX40233.1 carboxymuconolactone decarboxylase family protein [Acinetobacter baumannii]EKT8001744.1 carboxymuconolactone decarboxylase family protein [Acinetobacter baumannii]EKU1731186.1 carboxymuconolactone decarboxylase family protein [Acinetobacter baumannii]EKV2312000.1 carboxymuconolactone decarboxylase family protein [Acinetobacter baumannii